MALNALSKCLSNSTTKIKIFSRFIFWLIHQFISNAFFKINTNSLIELSKHSKCLAIQFLSWNGKVFFLWGRTSWKSMPWILKIFCILLRMIMTVAGFRALLFSCLDQELLILGLINLNFQLLKNFISKKKGSWQKNFLNMDLRLSWNWSKFMLIYPQQIQKLREDSFFTKRTKTNFRDKLSVGRIQNPRTKTLNGEGIKEWVRWELEPLELN